MVWTTNLNCWTQEFWTINSRYNGTPWENQRSPINFLLNFRGAQPREEEEAAKAH